MTWSGDRRSLAFGAAQLKGLGLASLFGLAALGGALRAYDRYETAELIEQIGMLEEAAAEQGETITWDLPNLDHPRVDHFVDVFTGRQRAEFARYLTRMGRYQDMISAKLEERGMPQDLIFLALVESGFNPTAYSRAHASGLWQFIPGTGRSFGLEMNLAVDERNDPEKATDAALTYLQYLYNRFGSWYLAAAAYNGGQGRVERILRQATGSPRGTDETFYRISSRLPRETRDYVPLIIAAARIAKEPHLYGFDDVEVEAPLAFDTVRVEPATTLASIARATGTSLEEIKRLNPQLKLERTRNDRSDVVRIPAGGVYAFQSNWPQMREVARAAAPARAPARPQQTAMRTYRVRNGDNLSSIAQRHGTSVRAIQQANGIRGDRIRAGSTLRIPRG